MVKIEIIPESIELIKLTDEEYFSNKYKDYISNSKLSLLNPDEEGSIEKYESGFDSKFSDSFELGGAVHAIVLHRSVNKKLESILVDDYGLLVLNWIPIPEIAHILI